MAMDSIDRRTAARHSRELASKRSEHIGKIVVHPHDSNTVYVAAQGPLWKKGGDRGLYKTTDGGETWDRILEISEHTGVNEVLMDPVNPDILYASAYQRRRHTWVLIDGGPESGIHKSTDGGKTWKTIHRGLPAGDKGRIGMAISPINPEVIYAIVEATEGKGGSIAVLIGASRGRRCPATYRTARNTTRKSWPAHIVSIGSIRSIHT